ncbi:MAG TPA: rod shape-determining protein MreD [Bacteroidales bacterium]|nr:rod shape-determining protein MreD [Bacteroidales bacterium]HPJ59708.1 rod shape-determining protein MreD [Bacteroidales bacterium]HPR11319.1 rod shape-determining protein MreD [Bacteroidales bacterium]HRW86020.1 rod shape-determining protein MreD [Bacteroidales bacterium]
MINRIIRLGLIFIILLLLQVLFFNNIQFSGYVNPYVYIMFILLLPVEIPAWLLLILSFLTGAVMDLFSGTLGMHASATLVAGFVRPYVLRITSPRDGYEAGANPSMLVYGLKWFLIYASLIIFIHHLVLFYIEVFRFTDFFRTLLRVILSFVFSLSFIVLLEYIRKGK